MSHALRINAQDVYYHVFARGNNRDAIFFHTEDYERFLKNLESFREKFGFTLFAYCLMPNHFHLLLRVGSIPISKIMQPLMTAYTMYANKKYHRSGHLFQGRFGSIIVEKESYLLQVFRYIHLNPVKSEIVTRVEDYPWSSYFKYLSPGGEPHIETDEILSMLSNDTQKQKQAFVEFTMDGLGVDFEPERDNVRGILGDADFVSYITRRLEGVRP